MTHPQRELPNPFHEHDIACDKLEQLESQVNHQQMVINTLMECVGLLMRLHNEK